MVGDLRFNLRGVLVPEKPRCTLCWEPAVQRVVRPNLVGFRCKTHKLTKTLAKKMKVKVFDLTEEAS